MAVGEHGQRELVRDFARAGFVSSYDNVTTQHPETVTVLTANSKCTRHKAYLYSRLLSARDRSGQWEERRKQSRDTALL